MTLKLIIDLCCFSLPLTGVESLKCTRNLLKTIHRRPSLSPGDSPPISFPVILPVWIRCPPLPGSPLLHQESKPVRWWSWEDGLRERERERSDTTHQPNAALISLLGSLRRGLWYKGRASVLGWSMSGVLRGRCGKLETESVTAQGSIETLKHNDGIGQLTSLWFVWTPLACKMSKNYCLRVSPISPVTVQMKCLLLFVSNAQERVRALFLTFWCLQCSLASWKYWSKGTFSWFLGHATWLHLSHMFPVAKGGSVKGLFTSFNGVLCWSTVESRGPHSS